MLTRNKIEFCLCCRTGKQMCDFEKNILTLLREEEKRLQKVFTDKDAPYMRSLQHGIKSAEGRVEECEYKQCMAQLGSTNNLQFWSKYYIEHMRCKK